jgi:MFS family permease|uniref:MFS transporter n=1 Tax=Candidatus Limnocylindrus sp. TaxID=2802978 RepID=UPI00404B72B7
MTESAVPRRSLNRDPRFLRLWAAETISHFGSSITGIALPFVAITLLNAGPLEVAILNLADFLPFLLIGLLAGALVDRLPRRAVLIGSDLGRAALILTIPVTYLAGLLTLTQLIAVGFSVGVLTVFFDVAYQAYLPSLIGRKDLVEGNSKLEFSRSAASLLGPGLGGLLVEVLRAPVAMLVDAISFLASALLLTTIKDRAAAANLTIGETPEKGDSRTEKPAHGAMRREVAEGLRFVFGHPVLRTIGAATATSNLFSSIGGAAFMLFAINELKMSPALIGAAFSIGSVGGLVASLVAGRLSRRFGVGRVIVATVALGGPFEFAVGLGSAGADVLNLFLIAAAGFAMGGSGTIYNINQVSLRQAITPEAMSGRMNATMRWFVWGTMPIGSIIGGIIGETLGVRAAILIGGAGATLAFVPLLFGPVWRIKEMPTAEEAPRT